MKTDNPYTIKASYLTFTYAIISVIIILIDQIFYSKCSTPSAFSDNGMWITTLIGAGFLIWNGHKWVKYYFILGIFVGMYWIIESFRSPLSYSLIGLDFRNHPFYSLEKVLGIIMPLTIVIFLSLKKPSRS